MVQKTYRVIINECCRTFSARHDDGCLLYTPYGSPKISLRQMRLLARVAAAYPSYVPIRSREGKTADVLARKGFIRVWKADELMQATERGARLGALLEGIDDENRT